jgi:hypothetical protein
MQLASSLVCALTALAIAGCAQPIPPPLTPNPDNQEVVVESEPADDAFSGNWDTPLVGEETANTASSPDGATSKETAPTDTSDECEGRATPELLENLRKRGATSRGCFTALLRRGTEARGQVKVALQIGSSGKVADMELEGDDVADAKFGQCLTEHFRVPFSSTPPENGCLSVKIPLNFSVKKESTKRQASK